MSKLLNFNDFEKMYESYGFVMEAETAAAVPPPTQAANSVIDAKTGDPKDTVSDLIAIFNDLSGSTEVEEAEKVNTLQPILPGEESDRVKEIQKLLGLKADGIYGKDTVNAVKAFQKEQKILVDGKVGNQTYGEMLKIKKGITDQAEIDKLKAELAKMSAKGSTQVQLVISDPKFYQSFETVNIIIVNGVTYVVCIPKKDAGDKLKTLAQQSGFEWLGLAAQAIGKALVYTTLGVAVVTMEVANAMINGVISASKFLAKGAMSLVSNTLTGLGQIAKWVYKKGPEVWAKVSQKAEDTYKGFVTVCGQAVKSSAEGLIAFTSALAAYLTGVAKAFGDLALAILSPLAKPLGMAWEGIKSLAQASKSGVEYLAKKGKEALTQFKNGVVSGYNYAKDKASQIGSSVLSGMKTAGKATVEAIGTAIKWTGDMISAGGTWIKGLAESLIEETGDVIYESLLLDAE